MKEPRWLEVKPLCDVQLELLSRFGGIQGVREPNLLESALHGPRHMFAYKPADLFDLAASYAHGIIRNHPFLDGNKRIGFTAAYIFLKLNGYLIKASDAEAEVMTLGLAAGEIQPDGYAQWLRDSSRLLQN